MDVYKSKKYMFEKEDDTHQPNDKKVVRNLSNRKNLGYLIDENWICKSLYDVKTSGSAQRKLSIGKQPALRE